jgi:hypothetical protein
MADDKQSPHHASRPADLEEHAIDIGTVAEVIAAGAAVYGAVQAGKPAKPPPPPDPDPPKLELPPGVDRD